MHSQTSVTNLRSAMPWINDNRFVFGSDHERLKFSSPTRNCATQSSILHSY